MSGLKRNVFNKINTLMDMFPAVVITGVRQCGKTHLSKSLRPKWNYVDLEDPSSFDRITRDPSFFFKNNTSELILDEAQLAPEIFKVLRGVIDSDRKKNGRFIITGSSSSELINSISESLAGRVAVLELGTLKTNERIGVKNSLFYEIFEERLNSNQIEKILKTPKSLDSESVQKSMVYGGYPDAVINFQAQKFRIWMDNYFKLYINRDIRSLFPRLDLVKFRRFVSMLASLSGQLINKAELGRSLDSSETSVKEYLDIAHGTFVWRNMHSYDRDTSKSIVKMPRGNFRDTGLLNVLLDNQKIEDLENNPYVGRIFEGFVTEEIIKGVESTLATNLNYRYFRTKNGAEIDLILSGDFGVLPIEIKYGFKVNKRKLKSLSDFVNRNDLPFGILVNNADKVEMISDKVIQIPVTYL